ncbi:MAG TPA: hypothetical protein VFJ61_11960 [Solirubrobacterales bacterium]|jgi:hypothetical protein|nr:hypothetical protein [Solirubrobacterales bacterium]
MKRTMWSDKRLDDLATKVDAGFERLDRDIRDLRTLMLQLWGSTIIGSLGIIATLLATR